jgi:hypothetical protein
MECQHLLLAFRQGATSFAGLASWFALAEKPCEDDVPVNPGAAKKPVKTRLTAAREI